MREHCTGKRRWGRIEKSMGASQGGVLEKGKWAIMRNYCDGFVSKQFLVEGRGVEPPSVAGSALRPASPAPAEGASPLARSPRRGHAPFESPGRGFNPLFNLVGFWWRAADPTVVGTPSAL